MVLARGTCTAMVGSWLRRDMRSTWRRLLGLRRGMSFMANLVIAITRTGGWVGSACDPDIAFLGEVRGGRVARRACHGEVVLLPMWKRHG